jgi:hypothetical protein
MLKFDLENMTKVVKPDYLPIGSVIDVETRFNESELMLLSQRSSERGILICQCGNRWGSESIPLEMRDDVKMKMVAYRAYIDLPSCIKVNAYYIPNDK